jgi:hypothetical protein
VILAVAIDRGGIALASVQSTKPCKVCRAGLYLAPGIVFN